jgi:hypothetical protein
MRDAIGIEVGRQQVAGRAAREAQQQWLAFQHAQRPCHVGTLAARQPQDVADAVNRANAHRWHSHRLI